MCVQVLQKFEPDFRNKSLFKKHGCRRLEDLSQYSETLRCNQYIAISKSLPVLARSYLVRLGSSHVALSYTNTFTLCPNDRASLISN